MQMEGEDPSKVSDDEPASPPKPEQWQHDKFQGGAAQAGPGKCATS